MYRLYYESWRKIIDILFTHLVGLGGIKQATSVVDGHNITLLGVLLAVAFNESGLGNTHCK